MAKLIYATPTSLDGYIANDGDFEWAAPDDEVFAFISDVLRPIGTYLYGRRTYETIAVWETPDVIPGLKPFMRFVILDARSAFKDRRVCRPNGVIHGIDAINGHGLVKNTFGAKCDSRLQRNLEIAQICDANEELDD